MVDITITVTSDLATKFQTALTYYNAKHGTSYTAQQMVKKLSRTFVIDTVKELRIADGQEIGEAEVEGL